MAAPSFVASASDYGAKATLTCAIPASAQVGDFALLILGHSYRAAPIPAGWTKIGGPNYYDFPTSFYRYIQAGDLGGSVSMTFSATEGPGVLWLGVYRGVTAVEGYDFGSGSEATVPTLSLVTQGSSRLVGMLNIYDTSFDVSGDTITTPSGWTVRLERGASGGTQTIWQRVEVADFEQTAAGTVAATFGHTTTRHAWRSFGVSLSANAAPNAPILTAPADASTINRTATQRFDWDFSDPDAGDTQSAYNLRYRVVGAATWTETGWVSTPNTYHDIASGTFADAVDYEWQVATKDAQGVAGPYSTSSFFTAGTAPTAPTITEPTNGGTFTQSQTVAWSTPDQDAYQIRVLDGAAVVSDTGAVESTTARSAVLSFPTNGVTRTIQVRVRDGGLWSQYAEVTGTVSWLAPPVPTFTITEDPAEGALVVSISNPAPAGAEPAAVYNDVYVTDPGKAEQRRVTMVAVDGSWIYHLPVSGHAYDGSDGSALRVVAVAENGVTSST